MLIPNADLKSIIAVRLIIQNLVLPSSLIFLRS